MPETLPPIDHHSGRFNRSPQLLKAALEKSHIEGALVIGLTEVDRQARGAAILHRYYRTVRGPDGWRGESALALSLKWDLVADDILVPDRNLLRGRVAMACPAAVIREPRTGYRLAVTAGHLPAGVERRYRRGGIDAREREHRGAMKRWAQMFSDFAAEHEATGRVMLADWNLDMRKAWIRVIVNSLIGNVVTIPSSPPNAGSLGRRLIDGPAVGGDLIDPEVTVLPKTRASDHRPVRLMVTAPIDIEGEEPVNLRIDGVDISHYQSGALDWEDAKRAGVRFVWHKATEGATVRDSRYALRRGEVAAAGLPFGAYHFASPDGDDAKEEAEAFLSVADPKAGDLVPMLDFEQTRQVEAMSQAARVAWVREWVQVIRDRIGAWPIVYTPYDLPDDVVAQCMLWTARYSPVNAPARIPEPWTEATIHQFSDGRTGVPNWCPGLGNVDLDTLPGNPETIDHLLISGEVNEVPDPLSRPAWRGRSNVDALTISVIEAAERDVGRTFTVTQGSYQSTVEASAGTHDGGGAVDLRWSDVLDDGVLALRQRGMFASRRRPSEGPWVEHVHGVVVDHPLLSASAARQVAAYRRGRNGLANDGPDRGPRITPIPRPVWPPEEEDDMPTESELKALVREALSEQTEELGVRLATMLREERQKQLNADLTPNREDGANTVRNALRGLNDRLDSIEAAIRGSAGGAE